MTDLVASIASEKLGPKLPSQHSHDLLEISGTGPNTVYVSHFKTPDGEHHVGFADRPGGPLYTHGIKWTTPSPSTSARTTRSANEEKDREYAKFITYVFQSPEIQEIECPTLHYSDPYQPPGHPLFHQDMCVPWGKATYAFDVLIQVSAQVFINLRVDPIIVVTPL